jgi:uncharacterized HAD superfamily protein
MTLKHLVLFDIDGVLADDTHRLHFALDKKWTDYFSRVRYDEPLLEGVGLAKATHDLEKDSTVQYLTGRRIDLYEVTKDWLYKWGLPNPERITMRGFADRDILAKYKAGVIKNAIEGGEFASVLLYDDDPEVVRYVNEKFGEDTAILTTWYTKNPAMVKFAKS